MNYAKHTGYFFILLICLCFKSFGQLSKTHYIPPLTNSPFGNANPEDPVVMEKIETSKYYDVVNFARYVQAEGYYSWGFNDNVCPPTSMYAAYNLIDVEKHLFLAPETGHWTYPEQHDVTNTWLYEKLGLE